MQESMLCLSALLLLSAIGLYHRFYLMDGDEEKLDAQLRQEECHRLALLHPRTYLDMLFWKERIMQNLHRAATYEQLCSCQALLANFKKYYGDMPEARAQWEAIECVLEIRRSAIHAQERLHFIDVRYPPE